MSNGKTELNHEINHEWRGSILRGVLGSITGMVIGWFYRLFHGRRSKTAACVIVGICTVSACVLWIVLLVLPPVFASHVPLTAADWGRLLRMLREPLLLCAGWGLIGFFFTRRSLLCYADWKRDPWYIAYAGGNGLSYNLLPEQLPTDDPPTCFIVHSRFAPGTHMIVEGSSIRWKRRLCKDRVFSARDIAGVVLGPSNGCNVLYDKNYQILARFAGSMEHADILLAWLLQQDIPIDRAPIK